jgi:hypothetical protein
MYRYRQRQSISSALAGVILLGQAVTIHAHPSQAPDPDMGTEPVESAAPMKHASAPEESALEEPGSWLDSSHGYMTDRTNALTQWIDDFFGDRGADLEQAESRLRLRFIEDRDETLGNAVRVRVGGKVNLPKLSKRLDLVFRGDDPDNEISGRQDPAQSRVGLQYQLGNRETFRKNRFDLTLGLSSSGPRPGVRYRYEDLIADRNPIRFTQRLQYEFDDGTLATSRLDIDHPLTDSSLIRSFSRVFWGEESEGVEWTTAVAHAARWSTLYGRQRATFVYAGVSGKTKPYSYRDNYFLGARYRMQAYREYLFFEIEPSYNWRINEPFDDREGAFKLELRLELLLANDLRRDIGFSDK